MELTYENEALGLRVYEEPDGTAHEVRAGKASVLFAQPLIDNVDWLPAATAALDQTIANHDGIGFGNVTDTVLSDNLNKHYVISNYEPNKPIAPVNLVEYCRRYWPAEPVIEEPPAEPAPEEPEV